MILVIGDVEIVDNQNSDSGFYHGYRRGKSQEFLLIEDTYVVGKYNIQKMCCLDSPLEGEALFFLEMEFSSFRVPSFHFKNSVEPVEKRYDTRRGPRGNHLHGLDGLITVIGLPMFTIQNVLYSQS